MEMERLIRDVLEANRRLPRLGLVDLTWGNASAIDRRQGLVAIKPSGVAYEDLTEDAIVVLDLRGLIVRGTLRPSSDAPTHLGLYRDFPSIGGIVHTHSRQATAWAQAGRDLPAFGTTHADHFHGAVPVTRWLTDAEVAGDYEAATGRVIVETFASRGIDPAAVPAALVAGHGPFAWGPDAAHAVDNALALEACAQMALDALALEPGLEPVPQALLDRHYLRKHGRDAYYGQE